MAVGKASPLPNSRDVIQLMNVGVNTIAKLKLQKLGHKGN